MAANGTASKRMILAKAVSVTLRHLFILVVAIGITIVPAQAQVPNADAGGQGVPEASPTDGPAQARPAPNKGEAIDASVRAVLSSYGSFQTTTTYGEVWVPTSVPPDWRPYAACHWVNSRKLGWYYDDRTPWGAIIHHYGRWTHDATLNWVWVPGTEFSPGWVSWRSSPDYIGWAPLPPNGDLQAADKAAFDRGGFWTFMETKVFDRGCGGASVLPVAQEGAILVQTQPVTQLAFAQGLWIIVLPNYIVGPLVDIAVSFKPWPNNYVVSALSKWNVAWNSIDSKTKINVIDCKKKPPLRLTQNNPAPPLRTNPCSTGYLQPDGKCGVPILIKPPPPPPPAYQPTCAAGNRPDARGRCPPQQVYNATPIPVMPAPPVIVPPPVVVPVPPPSLTVAGCRRQGYVRQSDGHCRAPVFNPPPPTNKPPIKITTVPPVDRGPVLAGCGILTGAAKRRCLDGARPQTPPPTYTTTVLPGRTGDQGKPTSRPSRPAFTPTARPKPTYQKPVVFKPARPVLARPVIRRPSPTIRRPTFRPRPKPTYHPKPRPQVRARPAPRRMSRPAPRRSAPRGGGGRRRR